MYLSESMEHPDHVLADEELLATRAADWIKCSERLPSDSYDLCIAWKSDRLAFNPAKGRYNDRAAEIVRAFVVRTFPLNYTHWQYLNAPARESA